MKTAQHKTLKIILVTLISIASVFSFLTLKGLVLAQTGNLIVAPARQNIKIDPGEVTTLNIKFLNQSTEPISGKLGVADFIVSDEKGTPTFIDTLPGGFSTIYSASSWVELPFDKVTIAAKDKVTIQFKIQVPKEAKGGGRYFGIYFEPSGNINETTKESTLSEAGSIIATRLAGLVYLRVSGPISESAYVSKFQVPLFLEYGPIKVTTHILNRGNYHIRPIGRIEVKNIFGKKVSEQTIIEQNIFPDAIRIYENTFGKKWMLGKYTFDLTASYGSQAQVVTASTFVWMFPWKVAVAIILGIIIIIIASITIWKKLKGKQKKLEETLKEEIQEVEELKEKYQDTALKDVTPNQEKEEK